MLPIGVRPDLVAVVLNMISNVEVLLEAINNLELQSEAVIEGIFINNSVGMWLPLDFLQDLAIELEELKERCGE